MENNDTVERAKELVGYVIIGVVAFVLLTGIRITKI